MAGVHAAGPPKPEAAGVRRLVWIPLVLLGVAWGVAVPVLTVQAALSTATFFGEQATAADHVEQHHGFAVALAISAVLVAVGLALSVLGRSDGGGRASALLLVPTLIIAMLWLGTVPDERPTGPVASSPPVPGACQEHSGGDTRCPGG